jgi:hypothetical protein
VREEFTAVSGQNEPTVPPRFETRSIEGKRSYSPVSSALAGSWRRFSRAFPLRQYNN